MKTFKIAFSFMTLLSMSSAFALDCSQAVYDQVAAQITNDSVRIYGPNLITGAEALEAMSENNTDLSDADMARVAALVGKPEVEFYNFAFGSIGDWADVVAVSKKDCQIIVQYTVYEE